MGTFHPDAGALHGITVVADTGDTVFVGRCHEVDGEKLVLLDADTHQDGAEGVGKDDYLARAARLGVWKKHDRLVIDVAMVRSLTPLSDHFAMPGQEPNRASALEFDPVVSAATPVVEALTEMVSAGPTAGNPVTLTDSARDEVRRLLESEQKDGLGLRLGVAGGGCSGLVYKVEFDGRQESDLVVAENGFEVYLDPKSSIYLRGIVLDYQKGLSGRGFQFSNPNASNTCGCGESFSV